MKDRCYIYVVVGYSLGYIYSENKNISEVVPINLQLVGRFNIKLKNNEG